MLKLELLSPPGMVLTLPVISLKTVLRPIETDQSQIYPKPLLCFDSHLLVNISRCSSQYLSVISSKHCLCLQLELRPTGTPVRLKNPDYLGLKTQTQKCQVGVEKRLCLKCNSNNIQDEEHHLILCEAFSEIRMLLLSTAAQHITSFKDMSEQ